MQPAVDISWVEKYITYAQDHAGVLTPTDYHLLAEICYLERDKVTDIKAILLQQDSMTALATYDFNDPYTFSNGYYYTRKSRSFDDLDSLESAIPANSTFSWQISGPEYQIRLDPVRIGGVDQKTQIPPASPIYLAQQGKMVKDLNRIDSSQALEISWNPFLTGTSHGDSPWDDLIFVLVSNCHGEIAYTSGAPGAEGGFTNYTRTSTIVPCGLLERGMNYVVFISQVKYVDHNVSNGIQQLAANSFAVELPIKTAGKTASDRVCPTPAHKAPYLWSGKTHAGQGLVPWPAFLDPSNRDKMNFG